MRRFLYLAIFALLLAVQAPPQALAQTEAETTSDKGWLTRTLEDLLSGAGREIRLEGFRGALSSRATVDRITIADDEGVWLTINDAVLGLNRSGLLTGRVDITELSAREILLPRLPASEGTSPEAPTFALPEIPVSVVIEKIAADRVELGEEVAGIAAALSVAGKLSLIDGEGQADLEIQRLDGPQGRFSLQAGYSNKTTRLALALDLEEAADGLAANLLELPGRPSVRLSINGDDPIAEFRADLVLETDGVERLAGSVALGSERDPNMPAPENGLQPPPTRTLRADISGDLAPVFTPEYGAFFGDQVSLKFFARRFADGRVKVEELAVDAAAVRVKGELGLAADGLPEAFRLDLQLGNADGTPVLLPLPGEIETRLGKADLLATFDGSEGDRWSLAGTVEGFDRPEIRVARMKLDGGGVIQRGSTRQVTAKVDISAQGVSPTDPGLAQALGETVDLSTKMTWRDGVPLRIEALQVQTQGLDLVADGTVDGFGTNFALKGKAKLDVLDLGRLSTLTGQELGGRMEANLTGDAQLLTGAFDLILDARAVDLSISNPQVDQLLEGKSELRISALRNEKGLTLRSATVVTKAVDASATGRIATNDSEVEFAVKLDDLARYLPELSGPVALTGRGRQDKTGWTIDLDATAPDDARADMLISLPKSGNPIRITGLDASFRGIELKGEATVDRTETDTLVTTDARLVIADLGRVSDIAGRPLSGSLDAQLDASGALKAGTFRVKLDADGQDLGIGIDRVDELIGGSSTVRVTAQRTEKGLEIERALIETKSLRVTASGELTDVGSSVEFDAQLDDARRVAPGLSGPARVAGKAVETGSGWRLDVNGTAPEGARADLVVTAPKDAKLIKVETLDASFRGITLTGSGTVDRSDENLRLAGQARLRAPSLAPLTDIVGRPIRGALDADIVGSADRNAGTFEAEVSAKANSVAVGIPQVDQLLRGPATLEVSASKSEAGLTIRRAELQSSALRAQASGTLTEEGSTIDFDARLDDLSRFVPGFGGPAQVQGTARQTPAGIVVTANGTGPDRTAVQLSATLPAGGGDISARIAASIGDLGRLVPDLPGPASVRMDLRQSGKLYVLDGTANGPSGTTVRFDGNVAADLSRAAIDLNGSAPLGLLNRRLAPRSIRGIAAFDLRLDGPLALSSLSGGISVAGASVALPNLRNSLSGLDITAQLSGSTARIAATAAVGSGGSLGVAGTLGLEGGLPADLTVNLNSVGIVDPNLYTTSANGTLRVTGPLAGGGRIAGTVVLDEVELRVPSSGFGGTEPLPDMVHLNEPADVRATRGRAGLLSDGNGDGNGGGGGAASSALSLDVLIIADNRIFVRGRGLDAELGGRLRITGTTNDVIPVGQFELVRGRLDLLGQRLTLDTGIIRLEGNFEPRLRLIASTNVEGTTVRIVVEGAVSSPEISFLSEPELPEDEVLSRLLFGKDVTSLSAIQAAQLASAVATLAGRGGVGIISRIRDRTGLDDLDVTTSEEGNVGVRAGKYLSENVYTDVTVDSGGEAEINLNLDISPSVTVKGGIDSEGQTGVGIFFERDY
ncbi:hypothetical protein BV394_08095 [Brevirhabdus pacifica]|uniref:Translocation and assembly module TamB C-terminal domain-containing protein n=1 Tax=Brevirhabdus pacifica TaxID=1267768 RepID=A0A1U7DI95_9RHOB|nr:translocation/assembly module TamB domain-containing protein [Brevirhabdus pacifica]APX89681.1 hypothetical protein BV394_08095 [Brevirhabdus pacifica]OWU74527.1 hypothetical protein ATO5_12740 [Loktanella sp. 22II-4b]PJJ85639.1 autotransporter secretion inner membrane protein TamB [Brevirhabdus pacifica]